MDPEGHILNELDDIADVFSQNFGRGLKQATREKNAALYADRLRMIKHKLSQFIAEKDEAVERSTAAKRAAEKRCTENFLVSIRRMSRLDNENDSLKEEIGRLKSRINEGSDEAGMVMKKQKLEQFEAEVEEMKAHLKKLKETCDDLGTIVLD